MVAFSAAQWCFARQENTSIVMDFPLTLTRPSSGGNNVVVYADQGDTKDIHENFVIVFGITFFSTVIFALMCYLLSCVLCKIFSHQDKNKVRKLFKHEKLPKKFRLWALEGSTDCHN